MMDSNGNTNFLVSKDASIKVTFILLDDNEESLDFSARSYGHELYDFITEKLGLYHHQYFDLAYMDVEGNHCWLDHEKPLFKTARSLNSRALTLVFSVKYYVPHPNLLIDDQTRYLFALQMKRDFFLGLLHSNRNTSLLLAAFIVQAELGDYLEQDGKSYAYLRKHYRLRSAPDSYLMRVMELHQLIVGLTKMDAHSHLLDTARKVELYGIRLHPAKNVSGKPLNLGVNYMGILVFQNFTRVNGFGWSKIRKLSFKRHQLLIKLHTDDEESCSDVVQFHFPTRTLCKLFWRKCIEQHNFFRSVSPFNTPSHVPRHRTNLLDSFRATSLPSFMKLHRSMSCDGSGSGSRFHSPVSVRTSKTNGSDSIFLHSINTQNPLKRLARFGYHASSLKRSKRTVTKQNTDSATVYDQTLNGSPNASWPLPEQPYAQRKHSLSSKPVGLSRLLSTDSNLQSDHFQLLRLSFTSLISSNESGTHTTPTLNRRMQHGLVRGDRTMSTPSVNRSVLTNRISGLESFVPKCLFASYSSSTLPHVNKSKIDDNDLDLHLCTNFTSFPPRPSLSLQQVADQPFQKKTTDKRDSSGGTRAASCSSFESLCSRDSPSPLCEGLSFNTLRQQPTSPFCLNYDVVGSKQETDESFSPHLVESSITNASLQITPPRLSAQTWDSTDTINMLSPISTSPFAFCLPEFDVNESYMQFSQSNPHSPTDHNVLLKMSSEDSQTLLVSHVHIDISSTTPDSIVCDQARMERSFGKCAAPQDPNFDVFAVLCSCDTLNGVDCQSVNMTELALVSEQLVSEAIEFGVQQLEASNMKRSGQTITNPMTIELPIDNPRSNHFEVSQSEASDLCSDFVHHEGEIPESLADAVSLGAISLLTGVSCYDLDPAGSQDDGTNLQESVHSNRSGKGRAKSSTSLRMLDRAYRVPSSDLSSGDHVAERKPRSVSSHIARAKSESVIVRSRPKSSTTSSIRRRIDKKNRNSLQRGKTGAEARSSQRQSELVREQSVTLIKSTLNSDQSYLRDLDFLRTFPVRIAVEQDCTTLSCWLKSRMLPTLQPLFESQVKLLNEMELGVKTLGSSNRPSKQDNGDRNDAAEKSPDPVITDLTPFIGEIFTRHLDLLEYYHNWITICPTLIGELWYLAHCDFLDNSRSFHHHPMIESPLVLDDGEASPAAKDINSDSPSSDSISLTNGKVAVATGRSNTGVGCKPREAQFVRQVWQDVESLPHCTAPLLVFLLQPARHLRQYCVKLGGALSIYPPSHPDYAVCKNVFTKFVHVARNNFTAYRASEQLVFTLQICRHIVPITDFLNLLPRSCYADRSEDHVRTNTEFPAAHFSVLHHPQLHICGRLKKYSNRGFQPRMVFLFSDRLLYASHIHGADDVYLKVHGSICLHGASVNSLDSTHRDLKSVQFDSPKRGTSSRPHSIGSNAQFLFSLTANSVGTNVLRDPPMTTAKVKFKTTGRRKLIFCAPNQAILDIWLTRLTESIETCTSDVENSTHICNPVRCTSLPESDCIHVQLSSQSHKLTQNGSSKSIHRIKCSHYFRNDLVSLCWRRRLSISCTNQLIVNDCEMHGYLLRKLQHQSGWQKLWVVLSDARMFFHKTPSDPQPQAILTLLGYTVSLVDTTKARASQDLPHVTNPMNNYGLMLTFRQKEYIFCSATRENTLAWFHSLQSVLNATQSNSSKSRHQSSNNMCILNASSTNICESV